MASLSGLNIYISDLPTFKKIRDEVKSLWYKRYGESLQMSRLLIHAMILLKNVLLSEANLDSSSVKKIPYGRTGWDAINHARRGD